MKQLVVAITTDPRAISLVRGEQLWRQPKLIVKEDKS